MNTQNELKTQRLKIVCRNKLQNVLLVSYYSGDRCNL